jgi:hypothetical protein
MLYPDRCDLHSCTRADIDCVGGNQVLTRCVCPNSFGKGDAQRKEHTGGYSELFNHVRVPNQVLDIDSELACSAMCVTATEGSVRSGRFPLLLLVGFAAAVPETSAEVARRTVTSIAFIDFSP